MKKESSSQEAATTGSHCKSTIERYPILILDEALSAWMLKMSFYSEGTGSFNERPYNTGISTWAFKFVKCDRILVLDKGKIAESGSHQTLMQQKGYIQF
ncbi:MAG: hypothetical protein CM1200mP30_08740 [Pseudomonadota bacterium]|nr:MAG: hypothetical protein CM1200mP30_08740 [Pseudomonadota bacterium]